MGRGGAVLAALVMAGSSGCVVRLQPVAREGWVVYGRSSPVVRPVSRPRPVTFAAFYSALAPDGEWTVLPPYGYVWRPHASMVGPDFVPYSTGGRWEWTEAGWQFEAEYPWSWATFHYGRWLREPSMGWIWVPGTVWGPAWVEWRMMDGYVAWAPLGPAGISVAVTAPGWSYVEAQYLGHPHLHRFVVTAPPRRK
ncbi:MAG TPA: DUF6600 domain-containing protein [Myxococcaceae bacterium]|nr:DUF6600 domain-containing protein [Myxococcaceae bacterium]